MSGFDMDWLMQFTFSFFDFLLFLGPTATGERDGGRAGSSGAGRYGQRGPLVQLGRRPRRDQLHPQHHQQRQQQQHDSSSRRNSDERIAVPTVPDGLRQHRASLDSLLLIKMRFP